MHVAVDIREVCSPLRTGKGAWTYGFLSELLSRSLEITLFTDSPLPEDVRILVERNPRCFVQCIQLRGIRWHWTISRLVKKSTSIDCYISPVSYIVPFLIGTAKPVILVVHDVIAFQSYQHNWKAMLIERLTIRRALYTSACVCTISETTKHDLLQLFPSLDSSRVITVYAGPSALAVEGGDHPRSIILYVSTLCPRKNQLRLIQAYDQLPEELKQRYPLVLVGGKGWHSHSIVVAAQCTPGVTWKGYVSHSELEKLYDSAAILAYPSLYEGFGLPVVEAMKRGIPVLTSYIGSMKEVADGAAVLVNSMDVSSLSAGMQKLLTDEDLRHSLIVLGKNRARAFSWKRTVDLFLQQALPYIDKVH